MRVLVDDLRSFRESREDDIVCRDEVEGMFAVQTCSTLGKVIDELWLDHDLGYIKKRNAFCTTKPLVNWLDEYRDEYLPVVKKIFVHSANPAAVREFVPGLRQAGYDVSDASGPMSREVLCYAG